MSKPISAAQTAYAAYGTATGGLNHRGEPMPAWAELPVAIQTAWSVAVGAVLAQAAETVLAARIRQPLDEAEEATNWALEHSAGAIRALSA